MSKVTSARVAKAVRYIKMFALPNQQFNTIKPYVVNFIDDKAKVLTDGGHNLMGLKDFIKEHEAHLETEADILPCHKSFPHVKALYEKYKAKGFNVFCVADDDSSEAAWKVAIEKDGLQAFHHVLRGYVRGGGKSDVSNKYAVHYLPTKYLIDNEGRIVGKFDDNELDAKLKEIFGF